jgi:hypothetical protein
MGSDNRTNSRRAAREARAHSRELGVLYSNLFSALEDWKKFHGMSDEEMQDWCVTVLKYHWTRKSQQKAEYDSRVYLDCPYEQKNKCKKLGGKWDNQKRQWYVSGDVDLEPFKEWINEQHNG